MRKTLKILKEKIRKRDEKIKREGTQIPQAKQNIKNDKAQGGWTQDRSMKKVFSIPVDVYYANPKYWRDVIKNKKFYKHPEYYIKK